MAGQRAFTPSTHTCVQPALCWLLVVAAAQYTLPTPHTPCVLLGCCINMLRDTHPSNTQARPPRSFAHPTSMCGAPSSTGRTRVCVCHCRPGAARAACPFCPGPFPAGWAKRQLGAAVHAHVLWFVALLMGCLCWAVEPSAVGIRDVLQCVLASRAVVSAALPCAAPGRSGGCRVLPVCAALMLGRCTSGAGWGHLLWCGWHRIPACDDGCGLTRLRCVWGLVGAAALPKTSPSLDGLPAAASIRAGSQGCFASALYSSRGGAHHHLHARIGAGVGERPGPTP